MYARRGMVHEIQQNLAADILADTVPINSFIFSIIHSVIEAKLKTSCSQNSAIVPHKKIHVMTAIQCHTTYSNFYSLMPYKTAIGGDNNRSIILKHTIKQ